MKRKLLYNRSINVIQSILLTIVAVCFSACSNDEPPVQTTEEKAEMFKMMGLGEINGTYKIDDYCLYIKSNIDTGGKWKKNDQMILGGGNRLPDVIKVENGRTWIPYQMKYYSYPIQDNFILAWRAYCRLKGIPDALYIAAPIKLSEDKSKVLIGELNCGIENTTKDGFAISYIHYGVTMDNYKVIDTTYYKDISSYKQIEICPFDTKKCYWYETERELVTNTIALLREQFGNVFDISKYLWSYECPKNPIIDLNELEEKLMWALRNAGK